MNALWSLLGLIVSIIGVAVGILIYVRMFMKKSPPKSVSEASWGDYFSFRESVKSGGLNPEKIMSYGKTYFTYDEAGKKIFIKTAMTPEGRMISSNDLASFELCRDGIAIEPEAAGPEDPFIEPKQVVRSCNDLHITIKLKDGSEINIPFIDSPTQYEYVYRRASDVANEIAAVLKKVTD
jgi:hypothetical protein